MVMRKIEANSLGSRRVRLPAILPTAASEPPE